LSSLPNPDCREVPYDSKDTQKPENNGNDHYRIQYFLYAGLHGDVVVDHPENHPNDDQYDHQVNQRHGLSPFMLGEVLSGIAAVIPANSEISLMYSSSRPPHPLTPGNGSEYGG